MIAQSGARVGLLARTGDAINDAYTEIHDTGATAVMLAADMRDAEQTRIAVERPVDEFGHVELLVNNPAVVWPLGPTRDVDPGRGCRGGRDQRDRSDDATRRVFSGMLAAGWGWIINASAVIAAHPGMLAGLNTQPASKGALEAHALKLAAELEGTAVAADVYRPGTVDTSMQAHIRDQPREQVGAALHDRFTASVGLITESSPGGRRLAPVMPDPRPASGSTARGRTPRSRTRQWQ